jgi:hypothetical protein
MAQTRQVPRKRKIVVVRSWGRREEMGNDC